MPSRRKKPAKPKEEFKSDSNVHDAFFKNRMSIKSVAISFFQEYLPANLSVLMDWKKLAPAPSEFVEKNLKGSRSDILYQTQLLKGKGAIYLHIEHQRNPDANISWRFLKYMVRIIEQHEQQFPDEPLAMVFPILLYQGNGKRNWSVPRHFRDFTKIPSVLQPFVPDFQYHLMDLNTAKDSEITGNIGLRITLLVMKHSVSPDLAEILEKRVWPMINELLEAEGDSSLESLKAVLYYVVYVNPTLDYDHLVEQIRRQIHSEEAEKLIMTLAEKWLMEGKKSGIEIGELRGEINIFQKMLKMPPSSKEELFQKTIDELKALHAELESKVSF